MSREWGVDRVRGGGAPARKRPSVRGKTREAGGSNENVYFEDSTYIFVLKLVQGKEHC